MKSLIGTFDPMCLKCFLDNSRIRAFLFDTLEIDKENGPLKEE